MIFALLIIICTALPTETLLDFHLRSFVMGMRKVEYHQAGMNYYPKRWFDNLKHTHIALDDALEQDTVFCNMLKEQTTKPRQKVKE